jgi:single-strand DNA-binding protein
MFGRSAETANQWLKKGKKVLIEGRLALDQWTGNDGQKRSKHSVIAEKMQFMDSKNENSGMNDYNSGNYQNNNQNYNNQAQAQYNQQSAPVQQTQPQQEEKIPSIDIDEEDIPF